MINASFIQIILLEKISLYTNIRLKFDYILYYMIANIFYLKQNMAQLHESVQQIKKGKA